MARANTLWGAAEPGLQAMLVRKTFTLNHNTILPPAAVSAL